MADFFDPTPEDQVVKLIEPAVSRQAERLIESCEHCNPAGAQILFRLDRRPRYRLRSQRYRLHPGGAGEMPELRARAFRENVG